ncbi:hypothetical protein [Microbacterium suwonense]|uniref:VOC domain-containing protein n=1 Tax=Microbacterium suwonense TaxID=683047 RepID=A0ABN6X1F7_9MICO|nr:hypothetical protein [Microbacterium suwonense]BDZ37965.1 hypothetical protein GCM10025863_05790 [Microbacterium suwonense]
MTTVQQIVYARHPERWHALAVALGLVSPHPPEPGWAEFDGGGILAIHRENDDHSDGTVDLHLLVDDLDAAEAALDDRDVTRTVMEGVGEMLLVRAASGIEISVSEGTRTTSGQVAVQPIWFQEDVVEARSILEAVGLRADIVADRGGWVELRGGGGGSVGVHGASEPSIGLGFLAHGDLDALAMQLTDAGFEASVVDEAYARTVRVADPEVWINGIQADLYGYHREA